MPRIHPRDFKRAAAIDKALPHLLPVCRDLPSARNELRWLREHAINVSRQDGTHDHAAILHAFTQRRAHGEPLQYILGSEFFGDLEIKCRPGVLIPRPETAASVSYLVSLLADRETSFQSPQPLRVLDLCSGSGCIPLLFHHQYYKNGRTRSPLELVGIDISPDALSLARENLVRQIAVQGKQSNKVSQATRSLQNIGFVKADVLAQESVNSVSQALQRLSSNISQSVFDIIISNPPYVSPNQFWKTPRSVRRFEPKLALVPPGNEKMHDGATADLFYPKVLKTAEQVKAKVALLEVSDIEQARRVATLAMQQQYWKGVEIWLDDPFSRSYQEISLLSDAHSVMLRGSGHGRSVFLYRKDATAWLDL